MDKIPAYGHWQLVLIASLVVLFFTLSSFKPRTRRDWRTFGAFAAFVVALFSEMYGFPLTIYLLSGWLTRRFPDIEWFSHDASHLFQTLLGWKSDAHFGPLHFVSYIMITGGLILLAVSWKVLYRAQRNAQIAHTGPYGRIRHPQYTAFMVIMVGFMIQWPTIPTLIMFPFLVMMYVRLARREERQSLAAFGEQYVRYAANTSRFFPRIWGANPSVESR
ncbi:MAG: isoprenylcysteine carboxylmethyltransferase family protein [Desulfobacterales bacterium]|nr:isoprenylcysteine carboxylmethyltransferase family protein [Desulfobacterales bacterium]